MKKQHLISILVSLVVWYLGLSFIRMDLNPINWTQENRIVFIVLTICTFVACVAIKELDE